MEFFGAPSAPTYQPLQLPEVFQPVPDLDLFAPPYNAELAEERRERLLTKSHSIPEKMLLYNCSTKGNVEELRTLLVEK